jgi:hypothetical protein
MGERKEMGEKGEKGPGLAIQDDAVAGLSKTVRLTPQTYKSLGSDWAYRGATSGALRGRRGSGLERHGCPVTKATPQHKLAHRQS